MSGFLHVWMAYLCARPVTVEVIPRRLDSVRGGLVMRTHDMLDQNIVRAPEDELESLVRADYERCHPSDSFEALKRRARFDKNDKGLLLDWLAVAAHRRASRSMDITLNAIRADSYLEHR
jgi:hypothetical protein